MNTQARVFLSTDELANRWRKTKHAIHVMRSRGDGPAAYKIGKRLLFDLREIEAYEQSCMSINTSALMR